MSPQLRRRHIAMAALLTSVATTVALASTPVTAAAAPEPDPDTLSKHDRELVAEAKANGERTVTMLIAAKRDANDTVVADLRELGAKVQVREDDISYVRADVPVAKAKRVAALSAVQAVEVDDTVKLDDPRPQGSVDPTPQTPPSASTPADNPYMPIGDTGAAQFRAAKKSHDGRDVKVGILDSGIDLDHSALRKTTTSERKIVDWVTYTDPVGDPDPTWVAMNTEVSGTTFTVDGVSYTSPEDGSFKFGVFNERDPRLGGELGSDVNRDGNPAGSNGKFPVLWTGGARVWVDTDHDNSFADEREMTEYKDEFDVDHFGTDNPNTAVAERLPFVVQVDAASSKVNIGIVSGAHGTHVAGIVGAHKMFGGQMSGAAPGSKFVSVRVCLFITGCTSHALLEGMIYAAKDANVDVINMSIGGLPALNDGNNARAVLYNRLIDEYKVQMFISAGNSGPGSNTVGDPSVAEKVVSVGTYITDATWASNYGSTAPTRGVDNQHPFSSRGPREDGGFKPTLIAPGAAVSTTPMWQAGQPVAGVYSLPPGYGMFNGTSMASPQAAGAAALIVSAAKQQGVSHAPDQLRQAMSSTSRYIDGYQAYEQGSGLIDVDAAYSQLKAGVKPVQITSSVPVDTALDEFLATPGVGVGIHDREGVKAGETYTRTYTFTRTSGPDRTINYRLRWVGNDGTFVGPSSVNLPKNTPVKVDIEIEAEAGEHSAILRLDDPATPGVDYATMNMVVAPHEFIAANDYSVKIESKVARNQAKHYFFRVPQGVPALKVDMDDHSAAGAGQVRFVRFHPYGTPADSNSSLQCYSPPVSPGGGCATGSPTSRTTTNPTPGVWEIAVEARRTSDADFAPFSLTVSVLGATVSPNPDVIPSATIGTPVEREYTLKNEFAPFTGRAAGTTLGSAKRDRPTIAHLAQQQYPVTVTPGSTRLRATIGNPADPAADLDLFVFNCTTGTCVQAGSSADGDSEESVTINNPAAGEWVVLVDGFAVPAGSTEYDYIDVFTNAAFGSVAVTDADAARGTGESWTVPGVVTANSAPAAGRVLAGAVEVRTSTNVLVGSGDVIVESVG